MKHQKLVTTPEISKRMSRVKLKRNKTETLLAKALWHRGYRYRLNYKKLPGSPDIAITKHNIAIFIDGEFWHGKNFEERKKHLKNNKDFWIEKIEENMKRDEKNDTLLRQMGWVPLHFWESEISQNIEYFINSIEELISENIESEID